MQTTALAAALDGRAYPADLVGQLLLDVEAQDDVYFSERESGKSDGLNAFSGARLSASLAFVLQSTREADIEAVYEACMTVGDQDAFLSLATAAATLQSEQ